MADPATYDQAIVETLRKRAVQSAILIDDRFPTYRDLLDTDGQAKVSESFRDVDDARRLYVLMHDNKIVCDVENSIGDVDEAFIDKIRKSDLVILDWNLNPGDDRDSEGAIKVLCGLSRSPHFNLVTIYTRDKLDEVWTRSAIRLRGGWREKEELAGHLDLGGRELDEVIDDLDPDGHVEVVTDEMVRGYVLGGLDGIASRKELKKELAERVGAPRPSGDGLLEALIHRAAIRRHGAVSDGSPPRRIEGRADGDTPFLNAGSVFVCLVSKPTDAGPEDLSVFDHLDRSLVAWKPSVLQLLVSELQNELEHHSYAFDHSRMPSDLLKAGWMFHMLREHGGEAALDSLVDGLNLRLVETIEQSVRSQLADPNSNLSRFGLLATKFAVDLVGGLAGKDELELVEIASGSVGLPYSRGAGIEQGVLHALNEYLSADVFRGGHVTAGTVLCSADRTQWWICVSPACDMVPRESNDDFSWQAEAAPFRPMNLLKLQVGSAKSALAEAEQGTTVFVSVEGEAYYLRATHSSSRQPRPVTCMLESGVPVTGEGWQRFCFAFHEMRPHEGSVRTERKEVFAVSQLRPEYSARFQHLAGGHQSRVGVDYVGLGSKKVANEKRGGGGA